MTKPDGWADAMMHCDSQYASAWRRIGRTGERPESAYPLPLLEEFASRAEAERSYRDSMRLRAWMDELTAAIARAQTRILHIGGWEIRYRAGESEAEIWRAGEVWERFPVDPSPVPTDSEIAAAFRAFCGH